MPAIDPDDGYLPVFNMFETETGPDGIRQGRASALPGAGA